MKILFRFLNPYWLKVSIGTILSSGSGICAIMTIKMINEHLQDKMTNFDLTGFSIKFSLLIIGFTVMALLATMILSRVSNRLIVDLRMSLSRSLLNANFQELEFKKEKLMVALTNDIGVISRTTDKMPGVLARFVVGAGGIIYLVSISWELSSIIFVVFGMIAVILKITNNSLNEISIRARKSISRVFQTFVAVVYGLKELNVNKEHKIHFLETTLPDACEENYEEQVKQRVNTEVSSKISEMLLLFGVGVLIILINYKNFVSNSVFIEFLTVSLFILSPLSSIAQFTKGMSPFRAAINEIEELGLIMEKHSLTPSAKNVLPGKLKEGLRLKSLSYRYFSSEIDNYFKLGPLDIHIPKGKITMIIGGNGSGKTTLGKLLVGLYTPESGEIYFDDTPILPENLEEYRNRFGVVFTDNYLFSDYSYIEPWQQQTAQEYMEKFELKGKVAFEDKRLTTRDLSVGQQKRLALIASLLEDKDLYLFDEWAANQDPRFKKIFYYDILPGLKKRGKTVIVITHDDVYFDRADHSIHLIEGVVTS